MTEIFNEEEESLVAYYILPLIGLSFKTFGMYFKDCKLFRSQDAVQVQIYKGCKEPFWINDFYQVDYTIDDIIYITFALPSEFGDDISLFCKGKYSKMSNKAKDKIYKHSGLLHNKQIDNTVVTDMKLLALTKSPILKQWIRDNFKLVFGNNVEMIRLKNKDSIFVPESD